MGLHWLLYCEISLSEWTQEAPFYFPKSPHSGQCAREGALTYYLWNFTKDKNGTLLTAAQVLWCGCSLKLDLRLYHLYRTQPSSLEVLGYQSLGLLVCSLTHETNNKVDLWRALYKYNKLWEKSVWTHCVQLGSYGVVLMLKLLLQCVTSVAVVQDDTVECSKVITVHSDSWYTTVLKVTTKKKEAAQWTQPVQHFLMLLFWASNNECNMALSHHTCSQRKTTMLR